MSATIQMWKNRFRALGKGVANSKVISIPFHIVKTITSYDLIRDSIKKSDWLAVAALILAYGCLVVMFLVLGKLAYLSYKTTTMNNVVSVSTIAKLQKKDTTHSRCVLFDLRRKDNRGTVITYYELSSSEYSCKERVKNSKKRDEAQSYKQILRGE